MSYRALTTLLVTVLTAGVALVGCQPDSIYVQNQDANDGEDLIDEEYEGFLEDTGHRFMASGPELQGRLSGDASAGVLTEAIRTTLEDYNHVAIQFDATTTPDVWVRVSEDEGASYTEWIPAELTFAEEGAHNAFAALPNSGTHLQLRFTGAAREAFLFLKVEPFDAADRDLQPGTADFDVLSDDEDEDIRIAHFELAAHRAVDVTRAQWGGRGHSCSRGNNPQRVVIHHTGESQLSNASMPVRARQLQNLSQHTKGFCDTMYHFLVGKDGLVYEGRGEQYTGAHALGANVGTIGVVFIGNYSGKPVSDAMLDAGARVLSAISEEYGIPLNRQFIEGHRHQGVTPTTCPGDRLYAQFDDLISRAQGGSATPLNAQGCTEQKAEDCANVGCGCVDGDCSGGFCPGSGCTAGEIASCNNQGCGCVDGACSGGACAGSGCTARIQTQCGNYGCGCLDGACSGGACGDVIFGRAARFNPVTPFRSNDTRVNSGDRIRAGTTRMFSLRGVPSDATAVTANITAVNPSAAGYLTVYPCGARPATSSLNFQPGEARPSQVTMSLSPVDQLCVYSLADVDVLIDVAGWWRTSGGMEVEAFSPLRLVDTRSGDMAGRLPSGVTRELDLSGLLDPATSAVSLNITSVNPSAQGFLTVYPCAAGRPNTSALNMREGLTRANHVTVPLDNNGKICVYTHQTATDLVVDLTGTWTTGGGQQFYSSAPARVTDTRGGARPAANGSTQIHPQTDGVLFGSLVAVGADQAGYASVFPCQEGYRGSSTLNFSSASPVSNAVMVDASRGGVCARVSAPAHLIFDTFGVQR